MYIFGCISRKINLILQSSKVAFKRELITFRMFAQMYFKFIKINFVLSFLLRDWQWPKLELKVQSLPEQRYHLGRKNYHVTKMYAVKGQNCQNEHCNFPWTTPVFKDRQKLVLLKENTMMFLLLSIWNPFIFKDYFAQVFIIKSPKLIFRWLHIPIHEPSAISENNSTKCLIL